VFEAAPQYEARSQDVVEIEVEIDSVAILICMGYTFLAAFGSVLHSRANDCRHGTSRAGEDRPLTKHPLLRL